MQLIRTCKSLRLRRAEWLLAPVTLCAALCSWVPLAAQAQQLDPSGSGWSLTNDNLLYTDTDSVQVLTTQLGVSHDLGVEGANVTARALIDVVSAASVDVVSHATQRFTEGRLEVNLAVAYPFGDVTPSLSYRISAEPDYQSQGIGAGVQTRLGSADTVLAAHYTGTFDTVGRHDGNLSEGLATHSADLGITQNLDSTRLLRLVYTLTYQNGYMEKPYRYVPLFTRQDLGQARSDGVPLGLGTFDRYRQPERPAEEVPDTRVRHALAVRYMKYIEPLDASLRFDYRFYIDDWLVQGNTIETALYHRVGDWFRWETFARVHQQFGASFWERTYVVNEGQVPTYRTMDRKLSPYWAATLGGRAEWVFKKWMFYAEVSGTQSHFSDFLFLEDRFALVSQLGLEFRP